MKNIIAVFVLLFITQTCLAQSPAGRWKRLSYTTLFEGKPMDTHTALLTQRPCTANIVYEVFADGRYRLDAATSGCDEKYRNIQERLWAKNKWKLDGSKFTTYAISPELGTTWIITLSGNKMTWKNEYDTVVYQRL